MRRLPALLAAFAVLPAAALPAWWTDLNRAPGLQAAFTQRSESAVFGSLARKGRLALARGGRLRVQYAEGLLLVSDGSLLVQYDPDTRTAQRLELRRALAEMPLLGILVDPATLARHYSLRETNGRVVLEPRRPGSPRAEVEARNGRLSRVTWVDGTGARQELSLEGVQVAPPPAASFRFEAPRGTRWVNP